MGLFNLFTKQVDPETAEELLDALIAAYSRKKWKRLSDLCGRHEQTIRDEFPNWRKLPEGIRDDKARTYEYVHTLISIAQTFENAGKPELLQLMIGDEQSNPVLAWGSDLERAQSLIDNGDPQSAIELLNERLRKHQEHTGTGVDHFLPRTHGMLGVAYYHVGDLATAKERTKLALGICTSVGDTDGIDTYSTNLQQMTE